MNRVSASVAITLSFLFPGLGHAYLGRRRAAMAYAVPAVLLAVAVGLAILRGIDVVLASLITPSGAMTILILVILTGAWRLISMLDAVSAARRVGGIRPAAVALSVVLVAVTFVVHGALAVVAYSVYDAGSRIFVAGGPDDAGANPQPDGSWDPGASGDDFEATPIATPETPESRINILVTGIDSAATRTTALTDTLLVVSINPDDHSVAMLSMPRDVSNFPLYDGRTFTGKINSLMTWARNHPNDFPDGPFPTLIKELGYLIGIPIHYYAAIDLEGFRRMIDEVGGVTVDNERAISDPHYDWLDGTRGFYLDAGKVALDGRTALAYVRSRQGIGDSDFTRAARQQQLLVALRKKLASPDMITRLPALIQAAGDTVRTNLPPERLDELIALARSVDTADIERVVLGPPYAFHPPTSTTNGIYTLKLRMERLAELSIDLFGSDSSYAED